MIGKNESGKMKGFSAEMNFTIMMVCGLLIGLYVLTFYLGSESNYIDYIYSSGTNLTATPYINTSVNGTQSLIIGAVSRDIGGETKIETVEIYSENTNTTNSIITVYLNSVVLGNITAINQSNTTTTFENLNYIQNSKNTLLYVPVANTGEDLRILNATGIYPSDYEDVKAEGLTAIAVLVIMLGFIVAIVMEISGTKK